MDWRDFERPRTIDELMDFVVEHNLPYEQMRFFIGEDYPGPKAFGIFRNADGEFVVYKNKANGERAIRYQGPDEEFAVRELWERMIAEIKNQKAHQEERKARRSSGGSHAEPEAEAPAQPFGLRLLGWIRNLGIATVLVAVLNAGWGMASRVGSGIWPQSGYYAYEDGYYCYTNTWYRYDEGDEVWVPCSAPGKLLERRDHFERGFDTDAAAYQSERVDLGYVGTGWVDDFTDTDYYVDWELEEQERAESDDDYDDYDDDDDWDWDDDDSWDSDDTDWDSDW